MINWIFYPQSDEPPQVVQEVVAVFEAVSTEIDSVSKRFKSNDVLAVLRPGLEDLGFQVE